MLATTVRSLSRQETIVFAILGGPPSTVSPIVAVFSGQVVAEILVRARREASRGNTRARGLSATVPGRWSSVKMKRPGLSRRAAFLREHLGDTTPRQDVDTISQEGALRNGFRELPEQSP